MFRRSRPEASPTEVPSDPLSPGQPKGRPTPTRKESEAVRKAALVGAPDSKASRRASRDATRTARYEARAALQSGDVRRLPARDAGPVKAHVRDVIDRRRSAGELFIPVAVAVLVLGFVKVNAVQVVLLWAWSAMLIGVVGDSLYLLWRLRRQLPEAFPDDDRRGAITYGILRSLQIRRLRLPPPKFKANGQPTVPKAKR